MSITLKRVQTTATGAIHYRRKLPKDVREAIGQREFKRLIGHNQKEAVRNYAAADAECERLIEKARRKGGAGAAEATPLDHLREARAEIAALRRDQPDALFDRRTADTWADSMLSKFPQDAAGDYIGVPEVTRLIANALRQGGEVTEKATPTLEDAKRLYLQEKVKGHADEKRGRQRVDRAVGHVLKALDVKAAKDLALLSVDRNQARDVRDYLSRDLGMAPATVRRTLNDIRAVFRFGLIEFGLADGSPFDRITGMVPAASGTVSSAAAIRERDPFPEKLLPVMAERLKERGRTPELANIWALLAGTGCRLAEVTGLPVSDVHLDAPIPYIDVAPRPNRRLKNAGSARWVPLVGEALVAAKAAIEAAEGQEFLFPTYATGRGNTSASAALMKHVKALKAGPKVVVHSLRHTMEDRLIKAQVPKDVRDMVLGHSSGSMGERYGGQEARLKAAYGAVKAAVRGQRLQ
ncbi:site-specific integrase [Mesorhizobium sp. YM1C-6-2]|uniref:site-specific integrase n=1 Tax=Mesorhizobium sp. YM1C-6-2 TaxID=1827501 RepID=UPI000EF27E98|nr:site-specific integrase [Mesorhizobium sp. YM1C-6-2]RLP26591.1 integrase [Mesorhizobium sp. YM1C-6-2]